MAGVPHGENIWKTIILGILITVAGYLIVHFITDKKDHKKEVKEKKEANENVWKSANDYIKSASKKFENIACFSCDYSMMKTEMMRELDQDCNSLRNLKEEKLIDEKLKTVIDRTISRFEGMKPVFSKFIDSIIGIRDANPDNPDAERIKQVYQTFITSKMMLETADNEEIDRLFGSINKEYKIELQRQIIIPEKEYDKLPGDWMVECKSVFHFFNDGKVKITIGGEEVNGTWSRDKYTLSLDLENGEKLEYEILQINSNILQLQPDIANSPPIGLCRSK